MKKLFTLALMMVMGCAMTFAQSLEFVDKNGNVIPNGTVFTSTEEAEDMGWCFEVPAGVFIKNNGGATTAKLSLTVKQLTEDTMLSCCAGGQCTPLFDGATTDKEIAIAANATESIETHWSYEEGYVGGAEIELVLKNGDQVQSTITLKFTNEDTGIDSVIADNAICNIYDITGMLVKANVNKNAVYGMNKGIYLVRELAGEKNVNKVVVK